MISLLESASLQLQLQLGLRLRPRIPLRLQLQRDGQLEPTRMRLLAGESWPTFAGGAAAAGAASPPPRVQTTNPAGWRTSPNSRRHRGQRLLHFYLCKSPLAFLVGSARSSGPSGLPWPCARLARLSCWLRLQAIDYAAGEGEPLAPPLAGFLLVSGGPASRLGRSQQARRAKRARRGVVATQRALGSRFASLRVRTRAASNKPTRRHLGSKRAGANQLWSRCLTVLRAGRSSRLWHCGY